MTGVAIVAGDAAGVSGRATGASTSAGVVTFLDGSQVDFDAELSADRRTLKRRGFGQPVVLNRQGSP